MKLNKKKMGVLLLAGSLLISSGAAVTGAGPVSAPVVVAATKSTGSDIIKKYTNQVVKLVNQTRAKKGRSKLESNNKLMKAAQKRAVEMYQNNYFEHARPDGSDCFTVLDDYNISYGYAGENIAMGQRNPKEVMNSWIHSSGHYANIISKNFDQIGVGYYKGYWVQLFISSDNGYGNSDDYDDYYDDDWDWEW